MHKGASVNNKLVEEHDTQLVLSYELLCLLRWLIEHDATKLKKMVSKAVASGLYEHIRLLDKKSSAYDQEDMQDNILDFLGLLETSLLECMSDHVTHKARSTNLLATVEQLDTTLCDPDIMMSSLEKVATSTHKNPALNPQEMLYKELLKRWKPEKKSALN
jgi:hypothetical protein